MRRLFVLLLLTGMPAFARDVRGRVSHTEEGSEEARKLAGGAYVLQMSVVTESGETVTLNAQEGITQVFDGGKPVRLGEVRAQARINATVDDDCKLASESCVAAKIDVEQAAGLTRIEAVKERAALADSDLDKGAAASMIALGGSTASAGREGPDQRDATCPEGMVPWIKDNQRVIDENGQPACRVKRQFIKGELTNLGSDKLVVADSRFGLRLGYAYLDNTSYLSVNPEVDMHFGDNIALGLGLPLNVAAYPGGFIDTTCCTLRKHDYDNPSDYAKILRFFTINRKEDPFYLNVSQLFAATIGHGALVRRYSGSVDTNITRVGAQLDAYWNYGGFEAFVGDIVQPQHFFSGLAFVKPLGWLTGDAHDTLGWTSIGVSVAMDLQAPYTLQRQANGFPGVGDDDICPQPNVAYCQPGEPIVSETRQARLVGLDLETKIVKTENVDLKPYADYSRLLDISDPTGGGKANGGGGFTLGMLGRFNAGDVKVHAFRVVAEGRYYDGNYLPGYFDTFYEVQKFQFVRGSADAAYEPKLRTILERDPAHKRAGYYLEGAYQYNGGLALMAAYEDSYHVAGPSDICNPCSPEQKRVGSRNLTLHIEYPAYSWLQFFASYYHRSFDGAPVDSNKPLGDNTLVYAAARLHVLWVLFLNGRVFRSWQADPVLGLMKNLWGGQFDLELGWEFDRSKRSR